MQPIQLNRMPYALFALPVLMSGGASAGDIVNNTSMVFENTTVSDNIIGTGSVLYKGAVVLTGTNTYTGGSGIADFSTLMVGNGGTSGSIVGDVGMGYGTRIEFRRSDTSIYSGSIGVGKSGTFAVTGGGTLIVSGTLTSVLGGVSIGSGTTLQLGNGGTTGTIVTASGGASVTVNGGTIAVDRSDDYTFAPNLAGTLALVQRGSGTTHFSPPNQITLTSVDVVHGTLVTDPVYAAPTTIFTGATLVSTAAGFGTGNGSGGGGTITVNPGGTFRVDDVPNFWVLVLRPVSNNGTMVLNTATGSDDLYYGSITGSGSVIVTGSGIIRFRNNAGYTGGTSVLGGTLVLENATLGSGVAIGSGGTVLVKGNTPYDGSVFTLGAGGTLQIGEGSTAGSLTGNLVDNGTLIFNRSDTVVFGGAISGTGSLIKNGGSTLILNGVNALSGVTTISSGTLVVGDRQHPAASLAGSVLVADGGTLQGHGHIGGAVTNTAGGVLAPGGSIGTLTVGSYTQGANSALAVEAGPGAASLLSVTGTATIDGSLNAVFDAGAYAPAALPVVKAAAVTGTFSAFTVTGTQPDWVYGVYYAPSGTEVDIVLSPKSAGQVYGDTVAAALDDGMALSAFAFDHAALGNCTSFANGSTGLAAECEPWSVWTRGFGGMSHTDSGGGSNAFNTHKWGFIAGLDRYFANGASLDAAAAYSGSSLAVSGAGENADAEDVFVSIAGHAPWPQIVLDGSVFYMATNVDVTRSIGASTSISSNMKSVTSGFSFQISHPMLNGDVVALARMAYAYLAYGPVAESGGAGLDLAGRHGHYDNMRYDVGVQLKHAFTTGGGIVLRPQLMAAFEAVSRTAGAPQIALRLAASSGTDFIPPSPMNDDFAALIRMDLGVQWGSAWRVGAGFDGRFSGSDQQALFHLDAVYRF